MASSSNRSQVVILCVGVASLALFLALAWGMGHSAGLRRLDGYAAQWSRELRSQQPLATKIFDWATDLGSLRTLVAIAIVASLLLLAFQDYAILAVWLLMLVGGEQVNRGVKEWFHRPRPFLQGGDSWSFPSGHALGAFAGYGMLLYVAILFLPERRGRVAAFAVLLVLIIGFSRVYLGYHFPSDVIGGYLAGAVWLSAWILGIESIRRSRGGSSK